MSTVPNASSAKDPVGRDKPRGRVRIDPHGHAVPAALRDLARFVTWRYEEVGGKPTKVPYRPDGRAKASTTEPSDWGSIDACLATVQAERARDDGAGLGLVIGAGYVGLDFDRVLDGNGNPSREFLHLVEPLEALGCYAEFSPSGTGVKVIVRAAATAVAAAAAEVTGKRAANKHRTKIQPALAGIKEVEVFHGEEGGYFTLTGQGWGVPAWDGQRWDDATEAVAEVMRRAHAMKFRDTGKARKAHEAPIRLAVDLSDEEVLDKAFSATNGAKVRTLYDGANDAHGGDASAADCALAGHLAFYAGPNGRDQVARILRNSPRWREKLEREDYMASTVGKAYEGLTAFYDPARKRTQPTAKRESGAGNAERAADEFGLVDAFRKFHHGRIVRTDQDRWFRMDEASGVFREDSCGTILGTAIDTVRTVLSDPLVDESTRTRNFKVKVASAVMRGAQGYPLSHGGVSVEHKALNQDPWLLGTPRGVLDLRTGEMRKGTATDLVTKATRVAPEATADEFTCPHWLAFLESATGGNREVAAFLQRYAGYCLTGDLSEHAVLWLYGPGGTGKSTFIEALSHVLGEYAVTMSAQVFMADDHGHPTAVASLHGARFASCSEFPEGRPMNEARLKRLSGGDTITARFMRQDEFSFTMQAKMVAATNFKPRLVEVSDATARRLHIVEFTHKPTVSDNGLRARLQAEAPGILRWMLDGLRDLLANRAKGQGLNPPLTVRNATAAYMESQDTLSEWWEECFRFTGGQDTYLATSEIMRSWVEWARANHAHDTLTPQRLAEFMHRKFGATPVALPRAAGGKRSKGYFGVALVTAGYDMSAQRADGCSDE